ncbi:hypothetical protein [uncultured Brevibacillus sp.]|nr:hypothetical protein [uncultured Brevibacillus sp.]
MRKNGTDSWRIMTVLDVLAREEYIEWQRAEPDKIEVLEAWERKGPGR